MTAQNLAVGLARGLAPLFQAIATRLNALEAKERGLDGKDGAPGPRGPEGPPGRDGRDGMSVAGPQGEKGHDGANGKDGQDGLGFEDLSVLHDGERGLTFRFIKGDQVKEFMVTIPSLIYRGVYQQGKTYTPGDAATWAGATWHCNDTTTLKPGDGSKAWTLMVKRGQDGRDGKDGEPLAAAVVKIR